MVVSAPLMLTKEDGDVPKMCAEDVWSKSAPPSQAFHFGLGTRVTTGGDIRSRDGTRYVVPTLHKP